MPTIFRPLNPAEESLLLQLKAHAAHTSGHLKRSRPQFTLEFGWWYDAAPLPEGIHRGTPQECFTNAANVAIFDERFIYVEGVVCKSGGLPVHHAWVTDGNGRAFDPR